MIPDLLIVKMLLDRQYYIVCFSLTSLLLQWETHHAQTMFSLRAYSHGGHPNTCCFWTATGFPAHYPTSNQQFWAMFPQHPGWTQGQSFGQVSLSPLGKKRNVLHVGVSVCVSCSMWLCGNLWLFTQVLVEFRLQETGIRVVLHQAVYPFLGSRKAATCSLLYILGN